MNRDAQQITRRLVLERYVLGTLEEDARAVLRAQVIGDPNVFAEIREIELDLLDAAARDSLDAECHIDAERERLAAARPLASAGTRRAWALSTALAVRTIARERPAPGGSNGPSSAGAGAGAPGAPSRAALRRAVAAIWAQVRIWPAAAVWLAIAVMSLPFSHNLAPNVASTPDVAATSTFVPARLSTSAAPPADVSPAAPTRAPFLRIDLTLSPGHLNAIVTSSGMFTGVWSLEIDSGTQRDNVPVPETGRRHP